jgi:hypothetical protein
MDKQILNLIVAVAVIVLIVRYLRQEYDTTEHYARLISSTNRQTKQKRETSKKCISGDSLINNILIKNIKYGDIVKGLNRRGEIIDTKVTGWIHFDNCDQNKMIKIVTKSTYITLSPLHNIFTYGEESDYKFAKNILIGDFILTQNGYEEVVSIHEINVTGYYAIMTECGNYFANDVLVHCFANIENPTIFESIINFIMSVNNHSDINPTVADDWIHPMLNMFSPFGVSD